MTAENHPEPAASTEAPPEIGYCWQCGYDLRGLDDQQCPECGFRFDVEAVRDMNLDWSVRRLHGVRDATLLQTMACCVLGVSVVARVSSPTMIGILAAMAACMAVWVGLRSLQFYFAAGPGREWDAAWRVTAGITRLLFMGAFVVFVAMLTADHWFLYRLLLLFAGIIYGGVEWQRLVEGRRRGKMYAIREGLAQSIEFSARINVVLLVASGVAMLLLIAVGR